MIDTFIVRGEWLDNIETLPLDMQDKVIAEIVRYGTRRTTQYDDDPVVFSIVNGYKGRNCIFILRSYPHLKSLHIGRNCRL